MFFHNITKVLVFVMAAVMTASAMPVTVESDAREITERAPPSCTSISCTHAG
ncbi:hypothetical protein QCA50_004586 [Cerrena zonata]|uniref:Uncharacterized protein n=1 Tax=Cerrena zonata TaxID=2478898 RepID=A0AAW0GPG6_9APHY